MSSSGGKPNNGKPRGIVLNTFERLPSTAQQKAFAAREEIAARISTPRSPEPFAKLAEIATARYSL